MGTPVRGATFTADGAAVHALELDPGHYVVHATGVSALTAHSWLGESVARFGDAALATVPSSEAGAHVH
jgi:hypothetical protein